MNRSTVFFVHQNTQPAPDPKGNASSSDHFAKLYDQYAAIMLGVITKIIPDQEQAVDLLQTAFRHVSKQMEQLQKTKQPLFVSLLRIARRVAVEALQENRKQKGFKVQLTQNEQWVIQVQPQHEGLTNGLIHPADAQRKALFDAVLFKNCTPEEAAAQVGISVEQARKQLRLAFRQVRTPKN